MNSKALFARTVAAWQLTFVHTCQMLHFLTRSLLLSLASIGVTFALFCCWLDRFRSDKGTAWIIPVKAAAVPAAERFQPMAVPARRRQARAPERMPHQPRTIDSLIRSKEKMHL